MIRFYHYAGMLYDADGLLIGPRTNQEIRGMITASTEPIEVLRIAPPAR